VAIAATILNVGLLIQPAINRTVHFDLLARCAIVTGLAAPVAFLLGLCFPIGMRLVRRISGGATAWMWGVNGACGVLSSVNHHHGSIAQGTGSIEATGLNHH
jgi:hypothetical protein